MKPQIVERGEQSMNWWEMGIIDGLIGLCLGLIWVALVALGRRFLFPGLGAEWVLIGGLAVFAVTSLGLAALQRYGWHSRDGEE
jgi:hypothetical protein